MNNEWKRASQGRGEFAGCSPEIRLRERAIRWAHKLYEDDYGKTPKRLFCGELMDQLGYGNPVMQNPDTGELQGDKSLIKTLYVYCLERILDENQTGGKSPKT